MPVKPRRPQATLHLTLLIPGGDTPSRYKMFHTGSRRLTPSRMELVRRLVRPDAWKRQGESDQSTWDEVQGTVSAFLERSN